MNAQKCLAVAVSVALPVVSLGAEIATLSTGSSVGQSGSYVSITNQSGQTPTAGSLAQSLTMSTMAAGAYTYTYTYPIYNSSGNIVGWGRDGPYYYGSSSSGSYGGQISSGDEFGRVMVAGQTTSLAGSAGTSLSVSAGSSGSYSSSSGLNYAGAVTFRGAMVGDSLSISQNATDPSYDNSSSGYISSAVTLANAPGVTVAQPPALSVYSSTAEVGDEKQVSMTWGSAGLVTSRAGVLESISGGAGSAFRDDVDLYLRLFRLGDSGYQQVDAAQYHLEWNPGERGSKDVASPMLDTYDFWTDLPTSARVDIVLDVQLVHTAFDLNGQQIGSRTIFGHSDPFSVPMPEPGIGLLMGAGAVLLLTQRTTRGRRR